MEPNTPEAPISQVRKTFEVAGVGTLIGSYLVGITTMYGELADSLGIMDYPGIEGARGSIQLASIGVLCCSIARIIEDNQRLIHG